MPEGGKTGQGPTDLNELNAANIDATVDASALALAAVFGPVSWPPGMPDYQKEAILERAEQVRNASGNLTIDNRLRAEAREGDADDGQDNLSQWAQIAWQEQAERDEWMRTRSTVAGVTMSGQEWQAFAKRLREDEKLREDILSAFRRRGMDEEEAERRYQRVIDVAEIAAIPETQRTEEQQQTFEKAKADPTFSADMKDAESRWKQAAGPAPTTQTETPIVERRVITDNAPVI